MSDVPPPSPYSPPPGSPYGPAEAGVYAPASNGLGIAGFVVSLVGLLLTCGLLCPIGLLLSLIALCWPPRGFAAAGAVIGALGSAWLVLFGFALVAGITQAKTSVTSVQAYVKTAAALESAAATIQQHSTENNQLPDGIEGNKLILDFTDGWNNSLRYDLTNDDFGYLVRSAGPDGSFDTEDDITLSSQGDMEGDEPGDLFPEMQEE